MPNRGAGKRDTFSLPFPDGLKPGLSGGEEDFLYRCRNTFPGSREHKGQVLALSLKKQPPKETQGQVTDSIGLLISILVRYPEVGAINYDADRQILRFTFMLAPPEEGKDLQGFGKKLKQALEAYNYLEDRKAQVVELKVHHHEEIYSLEVHRDVHTLSRDEIGLIVNLVREAFDQYLMAETNDSLLEEDLLLQEEIIERMLEKVRGSAPKRHLIAFREEGRVMVFNK